MESEGISLYNPSGEKQDLFAILKGLGMNAIRLRVWVDPADGWCNTADVVAKALRAKKAGMRIMIDFHYSDSWADPGKQFKPAAWENMNMDELVATVNTYTKSVLNALKENNIDPEWVQTGNETDNGMLWPDGKASDNMAAFASLVNAGYDAVKEIFPSAKVIVHISNGQDNNLFRWIFDGLKNNNARWDITGMSLYPSPGNWQQLTNECLSNMQDMVSRYQKPVMICEIGMAASEAATCKSFITDLMEKSLSVPDDSCLGIFYWEPECYNDWHGYKLGAFTNAGMPSQALDAFK